MSHAPRIRALLLAALMAGSLLPTLMAGPGLAQGSNDPDVPVPFEKVPGLEAIPLHFWRAERGTGENPNPCNGVNVPDTETRSVCSMQPRRPPSRQVAQPNVEVMSIAQEADDASELNAAAVARFVLDTRASTVDREGAVFPFTIKPGSGAIVFDLWYDSEAACDSVLNTGQGQSLAFHVQVRKAAAGGLTGPDPFGKAVVNACNLPAGTLRDNQAHNLVGGIDVAAPVEVAAGEVLVVEIFAVNPSIPNLQWSLLFEDAARDSRIEVRTDQAVEQAIWGTDKAGNFKQSFNPTAPESQRFMVGRMALRSPFGSSAIPTDTSAASDDLTAQIIAPDGTLVDLDNSASTLTKVKMEEILTEREENGARRIYKFANPSALADQPWHYPANIEPGSYTIRVTGSILGTERTITRNIAMGAFDFTLRPVSGETLTHQLKRDSSTTYLLAITNGATVRDTYQVDASFSFSSRNLVWSVGITGVDNRGRVSLDPGEVALLQVKVTPPTNAASGDAARIKVSAKSLTSTATKATNLEAQVTTLTVRDVGVLLLRTEPFEIGIDRSNRLQAFVWNRGTAVDSFTVAVVDGSQTPNDATKFRVVLNQTRFDNVEPGGVVPIPISVVTTRDVVGGDNFEFKVRAQSTANPQETAEATIQTIVEAVREFRLFALNGRDAEALRSVRHGKFNMSDTNATSPFDLCQNAISPPDHPSECADYTVASYHRFVLTNVGDQRETFALSTKGSLFSKSSSTCSPALDDRLNFDQTKLVAAIDHQNPLSEATISTLDVGPGETKAFYLRVVYDGRTPIYEDPSSSCTWETWRTSVKVALDGVTPISIPTETTVWQAVPGEAVSAPGFGNFQALVSLDEHSLQGGLFKGLPNFVGITPDVEETIPFTVTNQAGHEDQVRVRLGPRNLVDDLRDRGWSLEIVPLNNVPANVSADGADVRVPHRDAMGERGGADGIGHASGVDYPLGLRVTAPLAGIQENDRFTFSIEASSVFDPSVRDTLGINIQIGEDFAFEVDPGREAIEAHAGDVIAFAPTIKNIGASRDKYRITATAPGSFNDPQVTPSTLEVSPGSSKATAIQVAVPDSAAPGSAATITAAITSLGDPTDPDDDVTHEITYTVEVKAEGTLSLAADPQVVTIGPGGQASINFTIENDAAEERQVRLLEIFAPPGFTTTLTDNAAGDVRQVPAGGSTPFTYLVQAPSAIVEGSRFTFVVRAEDADNEADFANGVAYAVVAGAASVTLEAEDQRKVVDRGTNTVFNVLVRNTGSSLSWFTLSTEFQSAGWSARILDQEGVVIENATVRVAEKLFQRVQVQVTAPASVAKDHVEAITLRAAALGQAGISDEVTLSAVIHDFDIGVSIEGLATKDAAPGDNLEYVVSITNRGNGPDRIRLAFEDAQGEAPRYATTTELAADTTQRIEPGETLTGVRVIVAVPSPNQGPVPVPEGIVTVIRATSANAQSDQAPTVTTQVTTKLLPYVRFDVDGDGAFEVAVDRNRNNADGFEEFLDQDEQMIERGELAQADARKTISLVALDADGDGRTEHILDTNGDGIADVYFDPEKARTSDVPYTIDANNDNEPETPLDTDFDSLIDGVYDPATETVHDTVNLDFSGDGHRDLLIDTDDDGTYDTFVDVQTTPHTVTKVEKRGDRYEIDTDGDGKVDTYYNVQTGEIQEATAANLKDFIRDYWYFLLLFVVVVALFGVIVFRRL